MSSYRKIIASAEQENRDRLNPEPSVKQGRSSGGVVLAVATALLVGVVARGEIVHWSGEREETTYAQIEGFKFDEASSKEWTFEPDPVNIIDAKPGYICDIPTTGWDLSISLNGNKTQILSKRYNLASAVCKPQSSDREI